MRKVILRSVLTGILSISIIGCGEDSADSKSVQKKLPNSSADGLKPSINYFEDEDIIGENKDIVLYYKILNQKREKAGLDKFKYNHVISDMTKEFCESFDIKTIKERAELTVTKSKNAYGEEYDNKYSLKLEELKNKYNVKTYIKPGSLYKNGTLSVITIKGLTLNPSEDINLTKILNDTLVVDEVLNDSVCGFSNLFNEDGIDPSTNKTNVKMICGRFIKK